MDCFSLFPVDETENKLCKEAGLFHREVNTKWTNTEEKIEQYMPLGLENTALSVTFLPPKNKVAGAIQS